jgi:cytochrome c biogenesis protein ResB
MAVTLIGTLVILSIIMGLTPQVQSDDITDNLFSRLGFTRMTSAWIFVLIYFLTLLSLGALIIRRLFSFCIKDYAFYLNHIGLWILLFAAGMGAPDIKNFVVYVHEGETEWQQGIGIKLNDFHMEMYPATSDMARPEPKRFVSDIDVFSEGGKQAHALLEVNKPFKFGNWMLYQYGYDTDAGNMSAYSIIKLVYDPWVIPVYTGFVLLACGSVCMLWIGNKRKEASDDVE